MPALFLIRRVSLTAFLMSHFALFAFGVDALPDPQKPAAEGQPAKHDVRGYLRVRASPPTLSRGAENKLDLAEFEFYKRNLATLIKSPLVIGKVLDDKTVRDLPLVKQHEADRSDWLADRIEVAFPGDAELMTIGMTADDHEQSRTIVNAVIAAVINEFGDRERTDKLEKKDNLNQKFLAYKQTVLEEERQLHTLQQEVGASHTAQVSVKMAREELETSMHSRTELQKRIFDLGLKIKMARMSAKDAENPDVPEENIETAVAKDPQIQQAMLELSKLLRERGEAEKAATDKANDPAVARIRDRIKGLQEEIEKIKKADRQQVIDQIKNRGKVSSESIKALELEWKLLHELYAQVTQQVEVQADNIQKLEVYSGEADQLRSEIEQFRGVINEMGNTLTKWNIDLDIPPRISVIELAK